MKRFTVFALAFILFLAFSLTARSAEKESTIVIGKDYKKCTITLRFEESGTYDAYITSPEGATYQMSTIDASSMTCTIENVKAGDWKLLVNSADVDSIGKVTVSISASKEDESSLLDAIKVGKDISGLSIVFVDDTVVVKWTDETVGTVSVSVTNMDTNQIIGTASVQGQEYSCDIPEDVKEIKITIVPSTSLNVDGAEKQFVYKVDNHPNATVTFPSEEYCNSDYLSVNVTLNEPYGILVLDNGSEVLKESKREAGEHVIDIPLKDDDNEILLYLVDDEGNMRSYAASVIKDTEAPTITLSQDYDGVSTYENELTISGSVIGENELFVNGEIYDDVATDGCFNIPISLHAGSNIVTISAVDAAGNERVVELELVGLEKEKMEISKVIIKLLPVVLFLFVLLFLWYNKKKKTSKGNESAEKKEDVTQAVNKRNRIVKAVGKIIYEFRFSLVVLLVFYLLIKFVFAFNYSSTGSMEPTLKTNRLNIAFRLAYMFGDGPQRGDIVGFTNDYIRSLEDGDGFYKRIIGLPGEHIEFLDGYVYINGERLIEDYLDEDVETNCLRTFDVPEDSYFVMGDNRENSLDSRFWAGENSYISKNDILFKHLLQTPIHWE